VENDKAIFQQLERGKGQVFHSVDAANATVKRNRMDGITGLRMVNSLFLTKDLLIDWRGEQYFSRNAHLIMISR